MSNYYPPLGFHFKVEFNQFMGEFEFQSVSGLSVDLETEEIAEGGENRFKHKLPVRTKFPNLVLKRGLLVDSELITWCKNAIENFDITPTDLTVKLLNEKHEPLMTWNVVHAYPVKWSIADFNAEESKIVIETIELAYSYFNTL
jgi:phage tail-like protein